MFVDPPRGRPTFPGPAGAAILLVMAAVVLAWWLRGVPEEGPLVARLVGVDLLALGVLAWSRRRPAPRPPEGFRPVVVIPAHDNADTVGEVVAGALEAGHPVIVVDDGSRDDTARAAAAAGARVLRHRRNLGKGAALSSALAVARDEGFTHAICLDADGQHDPADIPRFVEAARAEPLAIHVGHRDLSTAPGASRFGRAFSNFWVRVETGRRIADSQSGFRACPIAAVLDLGLAPGRYEWEIAVLVHGAWNGLGLRDLPCRVHYPPPEERRSSFRAFRDNARISWLNTRLVLSRLVHPGRWWNPERPAALRDWRGAWLGRRWGWAFVLGLLRLGGRAPACAFTSLLAAFYTWFAPAHQAGTRAYLDRLARWRPGLLPTGRRGTLRVFRRFACSLVDRFLLLARGPDAFRFEHEGLEDVAEAIDASGVLLVTAHLGNPDLGGIALQALRPDREVALIQFTDAADPYLDMLRRRLGGARPPRLISLNEGADLAGIQAVRALREGCLVAVKGDRVVGGRTVAVPFLGETIHLPAGPFFLAAAARVPMVFLGCFEDGPRTYRVITVGPRTVEMPRRSEREAALSAWAREYAAILESWVARYPDQFYNFHDPWAP